LPSFRKSTSCSGLSFPPESRSVFLHGIPFCAKREIIDTLSGARHNIERYSRKNKFLGGKILLKIKGRDSLIYLNVDELKSWKTKKQ
jgi:hypothetical protein